MKRRLFFILFSLVIYSVRSQEQPETNVNDPLQVIIENYLEKAHSLVTIYSGKEQIKYPAYIIGHPYLKSDSYEDGWLSYEGILYPHVRLRLDLYQNELIIHSPDTRFNIILDPDKIDYANLHNYKIIYHNRTKSNIPLSNGYYLELPTGTYKIWRQSVCNLKETVSDNITYEFIHKDKYYFFKGDYPYQVKGNNSVLKLFPSMKKELKHYIKQSGYSFKKDPEDFLLHISRQIEILE